ncbi:YdcH family protein [Aestuariispira ectoiniformans]|uniref:YdcH family protein n=1 Tax=Aestuariispira ectoiniformans TaxID=2775080 RepID=UPI00223A9F89|nr:YdcH family protein [Aestuariispira ectoiniformans]
MLSETHDLVHELPEFRDLIHELKTKDNHFARLFDEYHRVNKSVLRMEEGVENVSDETLEEEKKKRLALKDELFKILQAA